MWKDDDDEIPDSAPPNVKHVPEHSRNCTSLYDTIPLLRAGFRSSRLEQLRWLKFTSARIYFYNIANDASISRFIMLSTTPFSQILLGPSLTEVSIASDIPEHRGQSYSSLKLLCTSLQRLCPNIMSFSFNDLEKAPMRALPVVYQLILMARPPTS